MGIKTNSGVSPNASVAPSKQDADNAAREN